MKEMFVSVLLITALFVMAESKPSSYQYVKFIRDPSQEKKRAQIIPTNARKNTNRPSRSYGHIYEYIAEPALEFWAPEFYPTTSNIILEEENGHLTPDFSNGLEYPDPLLLTGHAAKLAVEYLYGRGELFFSDIPHVRAILNNQKQRHANGLAGNRLGSLRPNWPFYRYPRQQRDYY